ncbi:diguanylate cyclase domain-containing protein, partial [Lactobacillus delbrueckii]|uniref:diguanylate cyclase domain-containing protein n=1 Tax=Lactobacillus delbrueckii TaxID=1584 RepID=UPI0039922256
LLVLLFVFLCSSLAIAFIVKRDWDNLNERRQAQTKLNTQLASDYFKKELAEAQNVTESIESGTVGNGGDSTNFADTAKYMLKKYPDIYSLQLIHGSQTINVYHKKATELGQSSLLHDAESRKIFEYCRKERINGIVGPIKTGKDKNTLVICKPIFIKDKFWGYSVAAIKRKDLFKPTFQKLDQLGYDYRLSKTHITDPGYHTLNANLKGQAQAKVIFRLGGCSWKLEAARKDAGQLPHEVKSEIFSGIVTVIISTVLVALLLNYLERGRRLSRLVDTDYLTGLMSRQAFDRDVSKYLEKHKGEPSVAALIDIDDFKYINDLYGHDAGDAALKTFAKVLEDNFGQLGKACRNGGDEFAVFLKRTTMTEGRAIFKKFFRQKLTFSYQGKDYPYTISLGFAAYPDQGASREELLNKADAALYVVKMTGKGTMAAYHPDMVKEGRSQLGFNLRDLAVNLPGAFFIYRADNGKILFANRELLRITECSSMEVFFEFIGRKVKGLIAPEDYAEAVESCDQQVGDSDDAVAHLDYHVITKETHKRIYVHAVAHMVKNPYFGEIYYVILSPKPEQK